MGMLPSITTSKHLAAVFPQLLFAIQMALKHASLAGNIVADYIANFRSQFFRKLPDADIVYPILKDKSRTFPVVQWLRICLPMQGTWVRSLIWEDPICWRATKPVSQNC